MRVPFAYWWLHEGMSVSIIRGMEVIDLYGQSRMVTVSVNPKRPVDLCVSRVPPRELTVAQAPKPQLILLHGNPASMHDFGRMAALLAVDFEVLAVDLPGFGRSADVKPVPEESVLDTFARHVFAAVDRVGWTAPVYVLGHSHGGGVAQAMAALFPERVIGLILIGTLGTPAHWGYRALVAPGALHALSLIARSLKRALPKPLRRRIVKAIMTPIFSPYPLSEQWVDEQLANVDKRPEILVNMALVATGDPCGQLARAAELIRAPALFIHGDSDWLVPARYARAVYELIARAGHAEFYLLPKTGHMLQLSHPEAIRDLIMDWRERLELAPDRVRDDR